MAHAWQALIQHEILSHVGARSVGRVIATPSAEFSFSLAGPGLVWRFILDQGQVKSFQRFPPRNFMEHFENINHFVFTFQIFLLTLTRRDS